MCSLNAPCFFTGCSVITPIAVYPMNGEHTTREMNDRQPEGILSGNVSLAYGPCGKPNGSYQFYRNRNSYIEFPNNGSLDISHSITILCWVSVVSNQTSGSLLVYYNKTDNIGQFFGMGLANARLTARFSNNNKESSLTSNKTLEPNNWHHVGVSFDSDTGNVHLWINGTRDAQKNLCDSWVPPTGYGVRMRVTTGGSDWNVAPLKGRITGMQIYNVSLTKEEIQAAKVSTGWGKDVTRWFSF